MSNNGIFYNEGSQLHLINKSSNIQNYIIQVEDRQFQYSKLQIAFLSLRALSYFENTIAPFLISSPTDLDITSDELISCFMLLDSLFYSQSNIIVEEKNSLTFQHIADNLTIFHFWRLA